MSNISKSQAKRYEAQDAVSVKKYKELKTRLAEMQKVLEQVQWVDVERIEMSCPICYNWQSMGHEPDCRIAQAPSPDDSGKVLVDIEQLKAIEWEGASDLDLEDVCHVEDIVIQSACPVCTRTPDEGHESDCWLDQKLQEAAGGE